MVQADRFSSYLRWLKQHNTIITDWNRLFKLTYFQFRAKLKELSESSFKNVLVFKGLEQLQDYLEDPEEAFIVPIDDDDWISPHLVRVLSRQKHSIVNWRMLRSHKKRASHRPFRTCSYAVQKSKNSLDKSLSERACQTAQRPIVVPPLTGYFTSSKIQAIICLKEIKEEIMDFTSFWAGFAICACLD